MLDWVRSEARCRTQSKKTGRKGGFKAWAEHRNPPLFAQGKPAPVVAAAKSARPASVSTSLASTPQLTPRQRREAQSEQAPSPVSSHPLTDVSAVRGASSGRFPSGD